MTGAPEGSPKVVLSGFMVFFMEKPGMECSVVKKTFDSFHLISQLL